jgi:hypothetical protein
MSWRTASDSDGSLGCSRRHSSIPARSSGGMRTSMVSVCFFMATDIADADAVDNPYSTVYTDSSSNGELPMNPLQYFVDRDRRRAEQDAAAPLAPSIVTLHPGRELDVPLSISLAAVRGCVGDHALLRRSADEDAAIVEMVLARLVAGRQLTVRGLDKVRADLRSALVEAGLT